MTAPRLTLDDALDVLPKVDLRRHVEGTMRPEPRRSHRAGSDATSGAAEGSQCRSSRNS